WIGTESQAAPLTLKRGAFVTMSVTLCPATLHLSTAVVTSVSEPSITNVQEAGVDEGGLVKRSGDHLVILRRGRLYTVRVGDDSLRRAYATNAFAPGLKVDGDWYDEMLVAHGRVIVIGYSYERGGTEIGLFRVDGDGRLTFEDTYHLRSWDYYSSRNYAARLIDSTLVFYTPGALPSDWREGAPAMRRWSSDTAARAFVPTANPTQVYRVRGARPHVTEWASHAVTTCTITARPLRCTSRVVIGGASRSFYVSRRAVYVWMSAAKENRNSGVDSRLVRFPLDSGAPSAIRTSGLPVDQFSFAEQADGTLFAVVSATARGDGMWAAERGASTFGLLRVDARSFGAGRAITPPERTRPITVSSPGTAINRFVGDRLLLSTVDYRHLETGAVTVVPLNGGTISLFSLPHPVDRIEALGRSALLVGTRAPNRRHTLSAAALGLTTASLGREPALGGTTFLAQTAESEDRSHAFFFRATSDSTGTLALPIWTTASDTSPWTGQLQFFDVHSRTLSAVGALTSLPSEVAQCVASCVDWYGNSRPIFLGTRLLGLLGDEIVEGMRHDGRVVVRRRITFADPPQPEPR
ncbi:MAG: beta-propeller domain-containing protein, partial [Gemmatimonadaceae bacterium]|nr:beta-propeller domain-containing protein [Gemmatimonadaceae bacterium]